MSKAHKPRMVLTGWTNQTNVFTTIDWLLDSTEVHDSVQPYPVLQCVRGKFRG